MQPQSRQVAYRIRLGDLLKGNTIFDGERFSYLETKEKKIARVNLVSNVVDKYSNPDKGYNSLTVDDGTGQIQIKGFSDTSVLLSGINIGDTVRIIGFVRYFNNELYILPEVVKKVDSKWAYVRKLELAKEYGAEENSEPKQSYTPEKKEEIIEEVIENEKIEEIEEGPKAIILKKIKENQEGIDIEKLILELKIPVNEINETISVLISEGEIYEPRPGHLRSLD